MIWDNWDTPIACVLRTVDAQRASLCAALWTELWMNDKSVKVVSVSWENVENATLVKNRNHWIFLESEPCHSLQTVAILQSDLLQTEISSKRKISKSCKNKIHNYIVFFFSATLIRIKLPSSPRFPHLEFQKFQIFPPAAGFIFERFRSFWDLKIFRPSAVFFFFRRKRTTIWNVRDGGLGFDHENRYFPPPNLLSGSSPSLPPPSPFLLPPPSSSLLPFPPPPPSFQLLI